MNKQVEQIRAEVYRRFVEAGIHEGMIAETREDELNSLLSFIDSMPEDPKFKIGDRVRYKGHQCDGVITAITDTDYICGNVKLPISTQDEMEFVEETVSKFDAAIQDGDDVRYNEDFGCRVNLSQLHRVAQRDRLNQFYKEFDEIIKPYRNSHNYKNLCISLVVWKQNFWRWLLWKAEIVSDKLTHSVTKISDQEEPVSDDLKEEVDKFAYSLPFSAQGHWPYDVDPKSIEARTKYGVTHLWTYDKVVKVASHFANWEKQQMMKTAKLDGWIARDEDDRLHLFEVEPRRLEKEHRWWGRDYHSTGLDESDFPDLKWEDEPVYVKLPIIEEDKV